MEGRNQVIANIGYTTRWIARIIASLLLLLMLMIFIGEGVPPLSWATVGFAVIILGFLATWLNDWIAIMLIFTGLISFYTINFVQVGRFPSGWVFPVMFLPGTLLIISRVVSLTRKTDGKAPRLHHH